MSALEPTVITFGKIHGGSFNIIIPESVEVEGSIRCLHTKDREVRHRFEKVVSSICAAHKAEYELDFLCGNRLLRNNEEMTELVQEVAGDVVGDENIVGEEIRMMVGEDFAEFSLRVPSCFYFIGTGNQEKGTDYPHHSPHFKIDENSLSIGVEMHVKTALEYFQRDGLT
jgi:amidohydrolase